VPGLSDEALREQMRAAKQEEEQVSFERRMLHGRIDVVRAEIQARIERRDGHGLDRVHDLQDLVTRLTTALTHEGPPPIDDELARFGADADAEEADEVDLDELPELGEMDDAELTAMVRALVARERRTSARRQALHRELDRLRAEHVSRLQERYADEAEA
jgi:hypothetical protein